MSTIKRSEPAQAAVEFQLGPEYNYRVTDPTLLIMPVQALPENYTLRQLHDHFVENNNENARYSILTLSSCLQHPERIVQEEKDPQYAQKILSWVSKHSLPTTDLFPPDYVFKDDKVSKSQAALEHFQMSTTIVFGIMDHLDTYFLPTGMRINEDVLLSWIAFTSMDDPWTSKGIQEKATELLNRHQEQSLNPDFILDRVLTGFIRPLFSNSRAPAITSHGRRAINASSIVLNQQDNLEVSSKTWKSRDVHAVAVFEWAIGHMDEAMILRGWHLCIPPLLILLDDTSASVRARGLRILTDMLSKTPTKVLQQTGLDKVFEDTVMPTLLLLPNTTPLEDSLQVLKPAYLVLFRLGQVRFPTKSDQPSRMKFLDRIMRQGILQGLLLSGENIAILELLLTQLVPLIESMGIYAVKHLKDLVPILSSILTNPFGPSHPGLILNAVKAVQTVILSCWPRMTESVHRIELIRSFALCWTGIVEDSSVADEPRRVDLEVIKKELKIAFTMLVKSLEGRLEITKELEPLIRASPELIVLFQADRISKTIVP